ncbi:fungal transcriptional regulatory protein [Purpureocillium lilacinum]|uniref:Fungal transcriptional regulatory protein n=1 Tax=Purpureocillium lilacinum TaxID=33203 RepID=A0A179H3M8_PURLI|nr:fungal transcriptional regulatory protein [Purpureocillium lilacinum]KAK4092626.1 hypothetical protein Purlil1_3247 [Purpureocillium lilacinum]OAQ84804.1 fungal transcriptional regulatory protein [Purpureocillium lilacinum]OAQ89350.1 fungal transcriptional regulatory protein [Purpureocillium lilacinum]PWI74945.1 hypothetical protein PCL_08259 [Purpureocillium lilacinum]GJN69059.1 hypothetical protein PLICBS_003105 [Purpureocillium lilacinum]
MASVASQNTSPHPSPYDVDSSGDTDESWQYIDYSSGASAPGSVGFLPSPASGSLSGFAIVGHTHMSTSPPQVSVSPMSMVDLDQTVFLPAASSSLPQQTEHLDSSTFATTTGVDFAQSDAFMTPQQYLFPQTDAAEFTQQELNDMAPYMANLAAEFFPGLDQANAGPSSALNPSQTFRPNPIQEWEPSNQQVGEGQVISFEEFIPSPQDFSIGSASPGSSSSKSPAIKAESPSGKLPASTRKVKAGKVEKNKKPEQSGKFVIMTPTSINAHAGKPNPFECFEAMRATQRGRKGPLANDTKESALQVRRLGACFCCHSRKVKCDKERPCKHCKRLMLHVPQLVCWQFQDFLTTLFPDFIRGHFRKDEMSKFLRDNVEGFHVGGVEQPCDIELFSGHRFSATMPIRAKFFTAKTCDVLQHWHLNLDKARLDIQANDSAPIGIEFGTGTQREELRKRAKSYIQEIVNEPQYAEQVTDSFRSTRLPTKVLRIVQQYAQQSDSTMVKRALSIYAMQYVMTRHLCITRQSIVSLHGSGLVPQNTPWVTPRVLARQVKSLIDELIMREMQLLFECFSKSLKPKHKREWAPCMASFLVLCLFMEAVETTTENFAMSQNEINLRNSTPPEYKPEFALNMCKELENMPFKQFAYQFHNIYQTHTKDANTKSFNPLFDDECMEQEEVDGPAVEMLGALRGLLHGEDWQEIQFLADDDILLSRDVHTAPIDASFLYTGRLVAKFLLSFTNEQVIFGSSI